jgi:nicotinate-nucleotide adenylyltransferase
MRRAIGRYAKLPVCFEGLRIGVFGGSFNPAHEGHVHVVRTALARLALNVVWVLVTPGNPLKSAAGLPDTATRMAGLRRLFPGVKVVVTDVEGRAGLRYSRDTVRWLRMRSPGARFVWLMGADNLATFHRWQDWRVIMRSMPIAVIDRPGGSFAPLSAPAALAFDDARLPESQARALWRLSPPAWIFLHGKRVPASSTAIRAAHARTSPAKA